MKYYCAKAKCQECRLAFRYAVTEEDIEDGSAHDVTCPRCGELVDIPSYSPCSEETYEEINEEYEELEDQFGLEDLDDEDEDEEDEWE